MIMADDHNIALDWQGYEEITKYIYEMLGTGYGILRITTIHSSKSKPNSNIRPHILLSSVIKGILAMFFLACLSKASTYPPILGNSLITR